MKKKRIFGKKKPTLGDRCVRVGKHTVACLHRDVSSYNTWHEWTLMGLLIVSYFLLKNFFDVSFAPLVGDNPLASPIIVLEPFLFITFGLLVIQKVWKSSMLGFILAMLICLSSLCFIVAIAALMLLSSEIFTLLNVLLLPLVIFFVTISMGKKYQSCLRC